MTVTFTVPTRDQWGYPRIQGPTLGESDVPATASITHSWTSVTNIYTDNTSNAQMSTATTTPYVLPYLRGSTFNFAIPSGATIEGVQAQIAYATQTVESLYTETEVRLSWGASASTLAATNKGSGTFMVSNQTYTYGGVSDLWGETSATITPAVVNSSDFGLLLKVSRASGTTSRAVPVDFFALDITYSVSAVDGNARMTTEYVEVLHDIDVGSPPSSGGVKRRSVIVVSGGGS